MPTRITEAEFTRQVQELADLFGWSWWHFADSRRPGRRGAWVGDPGAAGFPDLVLAHPDHGIIFAELKVDGSKGRLRPAQRQALRNLRAAAPPGVLVQLWRPADTDSVVIPTLQGQPVDRFHGLK